MRLIPYFLILYFHHYVLSINVLLYSAPIGYSHVQLMSSIADALIDAGHQVTILHPFLDESSKKHVSSRANRTFVPISNEISEMYFNRQKKFWDQEPFGDALAATVISVNIHALICDGVLSNNNTVKSLTEANFDVGIGELYGVCGFGLFEIMRVPQMIVVTATGINDAVAEIFNIPLTPSYIPASISAFSDRMTFLQRMMNFFWHHISQPLQKHFILNYYLEMFAKHGYEFDLFKIAKEKINYLLVNTDEYLDIARPVSQKVKYIGGIALGKPGKLDEYFENILQRSSNGTIVISFGTLASTSIMPKAMKTAIIDGIKNLPEYTFIWKVDESDLSLDAGISNLVTTKWLPQRELLNHSSVKVFVSHAGLNSVLESTKSGTPTIFVPIFADQFKNAAIVQRKNTTIVIQKRDFCQEVFKKSLTTLLQDEGYFVRARRLASLMNRKKETSASRLVEAVEYSATFGKIHDIDIAGYDLYAFQYFSVDVICAWLLVISFVIYSICTALLLFCRSRKSKLD